MLQLHIGKLNPSAERIGPIKNRDFVKPFGGIWTSTFLDEQRGSDWVQWCLDNEFGFGLDGNFPAWILEPIEHPNLFVVDGYRDLERAMDSFGLPPVEGFPLYLLDYEKMAAAGFDGFHVTYRGMGETHHSSPYNLYGYDCESTLWFRWAFVSVEKWGVRRFTLGGDE